MLDRFRHARAQQEKGLLFVDSAAVAVAVESGVLMCLLVALHLAQTTCTGSELPPHAPSFPETRFKGIGVHWNFSQPTEAALRDDISLVLQCDATRAHRVSELAAVWQGPISVAVLLNKPSHLALVHELLADERVARHTTVHLATRQVSDYPINALRNVAIDGAGSGFVFVLDIDESPSADMATHRALLQASLSRYHTLDSRRIAFVVLSFQWKTRRRANPPSSKLMLGRLVRADVVAFKHEWSRGYNHPNMTIARWLALQQAQWVPYREFYEPYFIAWRDTMPRFDERFRSFGYNAMQQTLHMAADGWSFVALPEVWSFTDEGEAEAKHNARRRNRNEELSAQFWLEIGTQRGCTQCVKKACVENCPQVFAASRTPPIARGMLQ